MFGLQMTLALDIETLPEASAARDTFRADVRPHSLFSFSITLEPTPSFSSLLLSLRPRGTPLGRGAHLHPSPYTLHPTPYTIHIEALPEASAARSTFRAFDPWG